MLSINVHVSCLDGIKTIDINTLMKYPYFNKLLTTDMSNNKFTFDKIIGDKSVKYEFNVPIIKVDCGISTLEILLLQEDYEICPDKYDDQLIELLLCNDMYMMELSLYYDVTFYNRADLHSLIYFVKDKLPFMNPYDILSNGGFHNTNDLILESFKLASLNELDTRILPDLFPYITRELSKSTYGPNHIPFRSEFKPIDIKHKIYILDAIILHYENYKDIILIENRTILDIIQIYFTDTQEYIKYNARLYPDIEYDVISDSYCKVVRSEKLINIWKLYSTNMSELKVRINRLYELGIIEPMDYTEYQLN